MYVSDRAHWVLMSSPIKTIDANTTIPSILPSMSEPTLKVKIGAGLGIAFFGLMLSWFYANSIMLPTNVPHSMIEQLSSSIGEAVQAAKQLDPTIAHHVITAAKQAFSQSHRSVLNVAALLFLILSIFILFTLPKKVIAIDE